MMVRFPTQSILHPDLHFATQSCHLTRRIVNAVKIDKRISSKAVCYHFYYFDQHSRSNESSVLYVKNSDVLRWSRAWSETSDSELCWMSTESCKQTVSTSHYCFCSQESCRLETMFMPCFSVIPHLPHLATCHQSVLVHAIWTRSFAVLASCS